MTKNKTIIILLIILGIAIGIGIGIGISRSNIHLSRVDEPRSVAAHESRVDASHLLSSLANAEASLHAAKLTHWDKLVGSKLEPYKVKNQLKLARMTKQLDQTLALDLPRQLDKAAALDLTARLAGAKLLDLLHVDGVELVRSTKQLNELKPLNLLLNEVATGLNRARALDLLKVENLKNQLEKTQSKSA